MRGAAAYLAPYTPLLAAQLRQGTELSAVQFITLMWLSVVQRYVALHHGGLVMHAMRYEDIVVQPAAALTSMFAYLGLPDDCVVPALRAFERDSQEGSFLSREAVGTRARVDLTAEHWEQVRQMLDRYPFSGDDRAALPQVVSSATIP